MYPEDESIAQILTDAGLISRDELAQAKEQAKLLAVASRLQAWVSLYHRQSIGHGCSG